MSGEWSRWTNVERKEWILRGSWTWPGSTRIDQLRLFTRKYRILIGVYSTEMFFGKCSGRESNRYTMATNLSIRSSLICPCAHLFHGSFRINCFCKSSLAITDWDHDTLFVASISRRNLLISRFHRDPTYRSTTHSKIHHLERYSIQLNPEEKISTLGFLIFVVETYFQYPRVSLLLRFLCIFITEIIQFRSTRVVLELRVYVKKLTRDFTVRYYFKQNKDRF